MSLGNFDYCAVLVDGAEAVMLSMVYWTMRMAMLMILMMIMTMILMMMMNAAN